MNFPKPLLRLARFGLLALVAYLATGPVTGSFVGVLGGRTAPIWLYGVVFSAFLLLATYAANVLDDESHLRAASLVTRQRVMEFVAGFVLSASLFAILALVRAGSVGAAWTFQGWAALPNAAAGLLVALVLLLPEELLFRGYAFRRMVALTGARPTLVISSILFGLYHLTGTGMWGMGAFFVVAMPALGGLVFGMAALRTGSLALPIGLHLGGNWIQSSVFSFQSQVQGPTLNALTTARLSEVQFRALTSPDFTVHVPFMLTVAVMMMATVWMFRRALPRR